MRSSLPRGYSRYVSSMKVLLPLGIVLSIGFAIGWPYLASLGKENPGVVDSTHPEIRENRMVHPQYLSTDEKGQPFQVDAEWAQQETETFTKLINPHGSMTMIEGQTFNVQAQKGHYDTQIKALNLEGKVTLTSTDGYYIETERAHVTLNDKVIEGDTYIAGEGPPGKFIGQNGFKIENHTQGKKVITLKGPSRVEIKKSSIKKNKKIHAQ